MQMHKVKSSHIEAIGYDPETHAMHVEFKNGTVCAYPDVSAAQHAELLKAESVGGHFAKVFRTRKFSVVKKAKKEKHDAARE